MSGPPNSAAGDTVRSAIVDVDGPGRGRERPRMLVQAWDQGVASREFVCDLAMPNTAGAELARALEGHRLRTYHCTRLLDDEVDEIRARGLRPFGAELFAALPGVVPPPQAPPLRALQAGSEDTGR